MICPEDFLEYISHLQTWSSKLQLDHSKTILNLREQFITKVTQIKVPLLLGASPILGKSIKEWSENLLTQERGKLVTEIIWGTSGLVMETGFRSQFLLTCEVILIGLRPQLIILNPSHVGSLPIYLMEEARSVYQLRAASCSLSSLVKALQLHPMKIEDSQTCLPYQNFQQMTHHLLLLHNRQEAKSRLLTTETFSYILPIWIEDPLIPSLT